MSFALEPGLRTKPDPGFAVADARRQLNAAKKRARYWRGTPFFTPRQSLLRRGVRTPAQGKFQRAVEDVRAWSVHLALLTGKPSPPFNPYAKILEDGQQLLL